MANVMVYGADWCGMTKNTLAHLKAIGVDHDYIDIDHDPEAAKWVAEQNDGKEKKPTLKVGNEVLSTPSNRELDSVLRAQGLLA
ncbi:MAG: NrdH-redoxin [Acidobacteriota bacterium]|nr:NrdH-redoxin [Acidobacteriota bacterium]